MELNEAVSRFMKIAADNSVKDLPAMLTAKIVLLSFNKTAKPHITGLFAYAEGMKDQKKNK